MRFLLEAARKNSRRIRPKQLLLLAVRMLILLLLVLALAQPYVETFGTCFQTNMPTHRIIVIDASYSMGHQPAERYGRQRFRRESQILGPLFAPQHGLAVSHDSCENAHANRSLRHRVV